MVKGRRVVLEMSVELGGEKRGRQLIPNVGMPPPGVYIQEMH